MLSAARTVFTVTVRAGAVFTVGSFHSAFTLKRKRADVFTYYPSLNTSLEIAQGPNRPTQGLPRTGVIRDR